MTIEELEGKLHQAESQRDYYKNENFELKRMLKERQKNYLKTNAEKTKRILELEKRIDELEGHSQMTIFDYEG